MKDKKLHVFQYIELSGLSIVLIATMLQITFLSITSDISQGVAFHKLESKLDIIWQEVRSPDLLDDQTAQRFWDISQDGKYVDHQKDVFARTYAFVMILGSFFLVLGRYLEMKSK